MSVAVATSPMSGQLLPQHLADLHKSGLSDAMIRACEFHSLTVSGQVREALRWNSPYNNTLGPCLAIPFRDCYGQKLTDYLRLKPDRPRTRKGEEKPNKYESPVGAGNRAYFPAGITQALHDPETPLLITEGEKKAAKAAQEGFPCVGLVGVSGWNKKGERELIDDLAELPWEKRRVTIAYDSDAATNPSVCWEEWKLANALMAQGAEVTVLRLPPGPAGEDGKPTKVGLDDFLVANGAAAFRSMLETRAVAPAPPEKVARVIEQPNDPHRLARVFLWGHQRADLGETAPKRIAYWLGEWFEWAGTVYRRVPLEDINARLTEDLKEEFNRLNMEDQKRPKGDGEKDKGPAAALAFSTRLLANVRQALAGICLVRSSVEPPAWIGDGTAPFPPAETLIADNLMIHLPSLASDKPATASHSLSLFALNALDYPYNPMAGDAREWLKFLGTVWPNDAETIATLQEWFGYCLLPDTSQQKILLVVGPKRSGKGTIARILRALVGIGNTCSPTLASLATNFGLWPLLHKTLAIISDARLSGRTDTAVVTERLLSISGEDAQTVDRKMMSQVTVKLPVRFTIMTNELPKLNDPSGALVGRFITLRQLHSFYGKEDTGLTDRLLAELPAILLWAIEGYKRLRARGHFVQPESSRKVMADLEELASPISAFVTECCEVNPDFSIPRQELFEGWEFWCKGRGQHAGSIEAFGRDLRAHMPTLETRQHRTNCGGAGRLRLYAGIRLESEFMVRIRDEKVKWAKAKNGDDY